MAYDIAGGLHHRKRGHGSHRAHPGKHHHSAHSHAHGGDGTHPHHLHHKGGVHQGKHAASHLHEPAIYRSQAVLQAFDSVNYLATIQLLRSPDQTVGSVPVSKAIPAANMVVGATVAVIFYDHHNSADGMVVGVH